MFGERMQKGEITISGGAVGVALRASCPGGLPSRRSRS